MKKISATILTFISLALFGQEIRVEINEIVLKIEANIFLDAEHIGYGGRKTDQYENFENLREKATFKELLALTKHQNSAVKGYASWALADRKHPELDVIFAQFYKTDELVTTRDGCLRSEEYLSTELYDRIFYQRFFNKISNEDSLFFISQIKKIDSLIINSYKNNQLLEKALYNNNGDLKNYEAIRYWAFKKENVNAIRALAVYQKTEDIIEFKKLKEKSFIAIAEFPNPKFWEFLLSFKENKLSKEFLMAVAAFKTIESAEVLSNLISKADMDEIEILAKAITKNYCSFYKDLVIEIWKNHHIIDIRATEALIKSTPFEAYNVFTIGLLSEKELKFFQFEDDYNSREKILPMMLDHIGEFNKEDLLKICESNIKRPSSSRLYDYLNCVKKNNLYEVTDEIIDRLESQDNLNEIFYLTQTFLELNSKNKNEELINILTKKEILLNSENWPERFQNLFKKHRIKFD